MQKFQCEATELKNWGTKNLHRTSLIAWNWGDWLDRKRDIAILNVDFPKTPQTPRAAW